jgi:hypothetical protein
VLDSISTQYSASVFYLLVRFSSGFELCLNIFDIYLNAIWHLSQFCGAKYLLVVLVTLLLFVQH